MYVIVVVCLCLYAYRFSRHFPCCNLVNKAYEAEYVCTSIVFVCMVLEDGVAQVDIDIFNKFRIQQQDLCVKLRTLTTSVLFFKLCIGYQQHVAFSKKKSDVCFSSITGTFPQYLSDLLQLYTPTRQLRSASDTRTFVTTTRL